MVTADWSRNSSWARPLASVETRSLRNTSLPMNKVRLFSPTRPVVRVLTAAVTPARLSSTCWASAELSDIDSAPIAASHSLVFTLRPRFCSEPFRQSDDHRRVLEGVVRNVRVAPDVLDLLIHRPSFGERNGVDQSEA